MNKVYDAIVNNRLKPADEFANEAAQKVKAAKRPLEDDDIRRVWLADPTTQDFLLRLREQMSVSLEGCVVAATGFIDEGGELARNFGAKARCLEDIIKIALHGESKIIKVVNKEGTN